jgi:hypothetical protein
VVNKLGISKFRRIVGAIMVMGGYLVALVAAVAPKVYDSAAAANTIVLPSNTKAISIVSLFCAITLSPFILFPCMFDRFPKWVCSVYSEVQLSAIAKAVFGVSSTTQTGKP